MLKEVIKISSSLVKSMGIIIKQEFARLES